MRRLTPCATTAAVATVVAARATGAGPITAARRMRRAASGISVSFRFVFGFDRREQRLHRDPAAGDELPARMPYCGAEGGRPLVLPYEHGGRAAGLDRGR